MAKRRGFTYYKNIASLRGGVCLSKKFVNTATKLLWMCGYEHQWWATPNNVQRGKWCPYCSKQNKNTIFDAQKISFEFGGECLSDELNGVASKLKWKCHNNHIWKSSFANVYAGYWCPRCKGIKQITIEELQNIAKSKGGECLSEKYENGVAKFRCTNKHEWVTQGARITRGRWCPMCRPNVKKTIEDAINLAKGFGGRCLSEKYVSNSNKLMWECEFGHIFEKTFAVVKKGYWCPFCNEVNSKQLMLYNILQNIFPKFDIKYNYREFKWLKTQNTGRQEIDIYIPKLRLAIEYDGRQHFEPVNFGGISDKAAYDNFLETKRLDKLKVRKIAENTNDISIFIRFDFRSKLDENIVRNRLKEIKSLKKNLIEEMNKDNDDPEENT